MSQITKNKYELFKTKRVTLDELKIFSLKEIKKFPLTGIKPRINQKQLEVLMKLLDTDG